MLTSNIIRSNQKFHETICNNGQPIGIIVMIVMCDIIDIHITKVIMQQFMREITSEITIEKTDET